MRLYLLNAVKPASVTAGAAAAIFTKYIFPDVEYLKWLLIVVVLDLATGITKVWAKDGYKAITSKGLRMTTIKFVQYGAFLIVTNVLTNFTVNGKGVAPLAFATDWAFTLLILIEIKSVYENIVSMNSKLDFIQKMIDRVNLLIRSNTPNNENQPPK